MIGRVLGLGRALAEAGAPVSPAELVDALRAVAALEDLARSPLRAALRATMVKDVSALPIFDVLFDIYFPMANPTDQDLAELDDAAMRAELEVALRDGDDERLAALAAAAVERFGEVHSGAAVAGAYYAYRTQRGLDLERVREELLAGLARPHDAELDWREREREARRRLQSFSRHIDDAVRARLARERDPDELAHSLGLRIADDVDIMNASREELAAIREAVRPLAAKLVARLERRRTRRGGPLELRRTIRRSLSTGGVPLEPVFRPRRPHRPDVVVLTDISGSVASFARFTLQLLWALAGELRRLRAFAFIDAVDEVTPLVGGSWDLDAALRAVAERAAVVGKQGHSDYGAVFAQFEERFVDAVSPRTTLIVLGDARANYHEPRAEVLDRLARRARATHWLNPEPARYWDSGDSVMGAYAPSCTSVVECRTLAQLERFVEEVL
ncbi:VWA containing CoxE family protein [Acidimicrobium ferrooxidans DSM 10331]|uniref:VWA containing CoxE family protein n=1 Tax=Acidimicrobium ferrooxidans (strain DSM 10331 / JCM 15462 / NBRC 103882 / ICP) TaxID=525909 RepID=C7LYC4_ACIFD|nr:VWA domain-containing protein [Acidimicrobium ferrooxidans]ACU53732.1 VWA containing CoxE family protein [Acidimicrobium ferrooxidans DSM 10331]